MNPTWPYTIVVVMICLHFGFHIAAWTESWVIRGLTDPTTRPVVTFIWALPFVLLIVLLLFVMSLGFLPGGAGTAADGLVAPVLHLSKQDRTSVLFVGLFFSFWAAPVLLSKESKPVRLFSALFLLWFVVDAYLIILMTRTNN